MATASPIDLGKINAAIKAQKASWKAARYEWLNQSNLLQNKLGVIVDQNRLQVLRTTPRPDISQIVADFKSVRGTSLATAPAAPAATAVPRPVPIPYVLPALFESVDWRKVTRGDTIPPKVENDVTSVKDQGGCGSCVSFGTTATLESMVLIEHDVPLDLSEAELLFCGGGSCGGWWPDSAVTYLLNEGESQEQCFPYADHNMPCSTCTDRNGQAIQITKNVTLWNLSDRLAYLQNVGPVMCVFDVYNDFFAYKGGTYTHVWGGQVGSHCVEVVGFFTPLLRSQGFPPGGYWICKNSWGSDWGEAGFFCIAFGQCGIDSTYPFWGIGGTKWYGLSP